MLIPLIKYDGYYYDTENDGVVSRVRTLSRILTPRVLKDGSRRWTIAGETVSDTEVYDHLKLNDNPHDFKREDIVEVICDVGKIAEALNVECTETCDWINEWVEQMTNFVGKTGVVFFKEYDDKDRGVPVKFPDGTCYAFPSAALKKVSMSVASENTVQTEYQYVVVVSNPAVLVFNIKSEDQLTPEQAVQRVVEEYKLDGCACSTFTVYDVTVSHQVKIEQTVTYKVSKLTGKDE